MDRTNRLLGIVLREKPFGQRRKFGQAGGNFRLWGPERFFSVAPNIECTYALYGRTQITNPLPRRTRVLTYHTQGIPLGDPRCTMGHLPLGRIATSDWSNCRVLDRMLIYERRIENSMIKIIKELKRFQVIHRIEIQEVERQREPSPSLRDSLGGHLTAEAATRYRPTGKKGDLKKQSQYIQALIGAKSFMQGDYNNNPACGVEENKPNQSQSNEPASTKVAGKRKKSLATANSLTG